MSRQAQIDIDLKDGEFHLARFDTEERLSEPFEIRVEGFCEAEVDFLPQMGQPVSLDTFHGADHIRYFHGRLTEAELLKFDRNGAHYRLTLRPWFKLLDYNEEYRIFQDKSVVDIAKQIFNDRGMTDIEYDKLTKTYKPRDYCVQYKESDFNFLSRLFEAEGIYYYFSHERSAHKLVLCDARSAHKPAPNYGTVKLLPVGEDTAPYMDTLTTWSERVATTSLATVTQRAFDFQKPQNPVEAQSKASGKHQGDALEIYQYPDDFVAKGVGEEHAGRQLDSIRGQRQIYQGVGDALGLACGGLVTLDAETVSRFSREYLITAVKHHVEAEAHRSDGDRQPRSVWVEAIPSATPFKPPLVTPRPIATGVETAKVVGPPGEAIYVDEWGRVKVRFHWDRTQTDPEKTSCWIRVSHHAAGQKFGNVDLPRVGQEVVVDFLNGDPDHPLVTGRVYNAERPHAYALPEHRTRSLWKTETVGASGGDYDGAERTTVPSPGFNEIRLEDKSGKEEFYIHAQREMLTEVERDDELKVNRDRKTRVGRDRTTNIKNNDTETVEDGDYKLTVSKGHATIEAKMSITLKCGQSTIVMDPTSITLKSAMITSDATGPNKMKGGTAEIDGGTLANIHAAIIKIN
jgi:type VI secretion system secreted protein VgrG